MKVFPRFFFQTLFCDSDPLNCVSLHETTLLKRKRKFFLIYKKIQKGSGAKSYMTNDLLIYCMTKYFCISSYFRKQFLRYDVAPDPFWISLYMRNFFLNCAPPQTAPLLFTQQSTYKPRVPQCLSLRQNWDPPPPCPEGIPPPPPRRRGGKRACGWGGEGRGVGPNSDDWRKSIALCLLCGSLSWLVSGVSVYYSSQTCPSCFFSLNFALGLAVFGVSIWSSTSKSGPCCVFSLKLRPLTYFVSLNKAPITKLCPCYLQNFVPDLFGISRQLCLDLVPVTSPLLF